ncbi:amidohydrolase [Nocardia sp. CDC159]|uniref:Amidohydrolase n=1 Tax=Nocardia pulmonis TaxID=2951408 RepID=A0A9X2J1T1_9NOCA|nr:MULTISPECIES: amidohydrolase [Nocardia]MCM6778435.1 amidohydrolase [Nocardia pulmonis]MCM6791324.1 amidohydrolase [Nocardia sp. CDC159]
MAVRGGRIAATADVREWTGPDTEYLDLGGGFAMAGLVDVHTHTDGGYKELFECVLPPEASFDDILAAVRSAASGRGEHEWIVGGSWPNTLADRLGSRAALEALDDAAGGRPVLLSDDSYHNRWVSSAALRAAGIVDGGDGVVCDPQDGRPVGLLTEPAGIAVDRAAAAAQGDIHEREVRGTAHAVSTLNSFGITAFGEAAASLATLRALDRLDHEGTLSAWAVSAMMARDPIRGSEPVGEALFEQGQQLRGRCHLPTFVKIFLDGVPPSRTAYFLEPYVPSGDQDDQWRGRPAMDSAELTEWLRVAARRNLSVKIHCSGDASVRQALDAVARLRADGDRDTIVHIAHAHFVDPADLGRFAELDVVADMSPPLWFPGPLVDQTSAPLGQARLQRLSPCRDLIDAGALLAGGSDWPVSEPNPWPAIAGLVTREDPTGRRTGALGPHQRLTVAEALAMYSHNGARALRIDDRTGSLRPGRSADFIVLDRNPFDVDPHDLAETQVLATYFAGKRIEKNSNT